MDDQERESAKPAKRSYWEVFMDDIFLIFFLSAAIMFLLYTVWGLVELANVQPHPMLTN